MTSTTIPTQRPVHLAKDEGVTDLWWPYGPAAGRYTIKAGGAQSQGALVQLLVREQRGAAVPLHVHHDVDETFYLISGRLSAWVGGERIDARSGDYLLLPRGVPHTWIITSEECEMLITCGPAGTPGPEGSGIEGFFREVADPVVAGEPAPAPREPDPEVFARRMLAHGIELLGPPPALD